MAHFIDGNPPELTPPVTLTITGLIMITQVQYVYFPFSYIHAVAAPTTLLPTFAPTATRIPPSTGIMIIGHVHVAMHIAIVSCHLLILCNEFYSCSLSTE